VRFGISVPNIGDLGTLIELGIEADRTGWDGYFLWDHMRFMKEFPVPVFDPWVALGAIAARTERVRLGTLVTPVARRRPWKLARETVTLDHLSGGRAILGVGLGYPPDADFEFLGEDPDDHVRAAKLDEGLEVLTRLWAGEPFDFEGEHFHVRETQFQPTPLQRPRIPIWVAGMWPNRAPFRRAARYDGVVPIRVDERGMPAALGADELAELVAYVREHRTSDEPFDVVHGGSSEPDAMRASATAGATWYLADAGVEGPGWEEPTLELVREGPPSAGGVSPSGRASPRP
jgi:alkanesulfonate monooxygenase SsuD/methylene tetrahydromethanopterin reductase-like flavin-dependent oxidoreductase (luciferase family)